MENTPNQLPALADSAHGQIVDTVKSAKALLGRLEDAASKRLGSSQLRAMLLNLRTIDLAPIQESIDQIAADERASLLAQEAEARAALEELTRAREIHERYHTSNVQQALPA